MKFKQVLLICFILISGQLNPMKQPKPIKPIPKKYSIDDLKKLFRDLKVSEIDEETKKKIKEFNNKTNYKKKKRKQLEKSDRYISQAYKD